MNYLTRFFLFMVARLGLFIAVELWLASFWWGFDCTGSVLGRSVELVVCDKGIAVAKSDLAGLPLEYRFSTPEDVGEARWVFEPSDKDLQSAEFTQPFPGINCMKGPSAFIVSVRHWIPIVVFAAFYATLRFVYRKPKGAVVADPVVVEAVDNAGVENKS
ncbi:MAG: hypothetical protein WAO83_03420 [Fuerstiella sp.]